MSIGPAALKWGFLFRWLRIEVIRVNELNGKEIDCYPQKVWFPVGTGVSYDHDSNLIGYSKQKDEKRKEEEEKEEEGNANRVIY